MAAARDYVYRLALGLWMGALVGFGGFVAPSLFRVLPTRALAGTVVNDVLPRLEWFGLACIAVAAAAAATDGFAGRAEKVRAGLLAGMVALVLVSAFAVTPRLHALRIQLGPDIEAVPKGDPARQEFGRLHGVSSGLLLLDALLGLAAFGLLPRGRRVTETPVSSHA